MNEFRCPACGLAYDQTDNYCRRCGRNLKPGMGFFNSHTGIILVALLAGPFALPLVWTSKRISRTAKIIYTVLLVILGYYLVLACWQIYQMTLQTAHALMGGF